MRGTPQALPDKCAADFGAVVVLLLLLLLSLLLSLLLFVLLLLLLLMFAGAPCLWCPELLQAGLTCWFLC